MELHTEVQSYLDEVAAANLPGWNTMPAEKARRMFTALDQRFGEREAVHEVQDVELNGIPVRLYKPADSNCMACLVFFHGGGWVLGNRDTHDALCRRIANRVECMVASVDYRLSPEYKFPTALEDCHTALIQLADRATEFGIDRTRIAVGGDSAGGNLAAAVSLRNRDQSGPHICWQWLIYPITDYNFQTSSYLEFAEGYGLTRSVMMWFWEHYLAQESDAMTGYASPLRAENLSNLPPALVVTAEADVLRDEGEAYAERLSAAGVAVDLVRFPGVIHGFLHMGGVFSCATTALEELTPAAQQGMQLG